MYSLETLIPLKHTLLETPHSEARCAHRVLADFPPHLRAVLRRPDGGDGDWPAVDAEDVHLERGAKSVSLDPGMACARVFEGCRACAREMPSSARESPTSF